MTNTEIAPKARVHLKRAENAKVNGISIEIEGTPEDLAEIVDQAFGEFARAIERMRQHDPQNASK